MVGGYERIIIGMDDIEDLQSDSPTIDDRTEPISDEQRAANLAALEKRRADEAIELQKRYENTYANSVSYTARYKAGRAINIDQAELDQNLGIWVRKLREDLNQPEVFNKRIDALKDAKTLFVMSKDLFARALLEEVYQNNEYPGFRREAGEALGYSGLRIFVHEHPVAATITGIAAIAATTYTAIQYLS